MGVLFNGGILLEEPASSGETGYFNEELSDYGTRSRGAIYFDVSFKCQDITYVFLYREVDDRIDTDYLQYRETSSVLLAYDVDASGGTDEAYRIITLESPATGDLLTFLQANATKIS